jgi:pimeloyl-ACP methyl ester carboxylesterase
MINYYRPNTRAFLRGQQSHIVQLPTLMIWGEHDRALAIELTEGYGGLVDDLTLRHLPDASHRVQQDAPDAVNETLSAWLVARGLIVP